MMVEVSLFRLSLDRITAHGPRTACFARLPSYAESPKRYMVVRWLPTILRASSNQSVSPMFTKSVLDAEKVF